MTDTTIPAAAAPRLSRFRRLRQELVTPESIYGTILVSALIALAEENENDFDTMWVVVVTSFVFWIAHVFAATVANHGKRNGEEIAIGDAFSLAVRHSAGLLTSAMIPILFLALGAIDVIPTEVAYYMALTVGVVILFLLGLMALAERGAAWPVRIAGGLATALLGAIVIALKAYFH
jgi:hypothetical protein